MAVKALLVIMTALSGCNLCYSQWTCYRHTGKNYFNLVCSHELAEDDRIEIYLDQQTLHIVCSPGPIIIDLTTFTNETLELRVEHNSQESLGTIIENCNLGDSKNFSALFKHFGIESEITSFEGINISPPVYSLDARFSSGFEKVKKFTLHDNIINQFNDKVFQSMPEISNLDLSQNNIANLDRNVFEKLTKLKTLDLSWNKLTTLSEGMFKNQGHLTVLFVKGNRLRDLTKGMFQGLKSLNVLLFNGNFHSIHLKDDVFHHLPSLRQISLGSGNMEVPYAIFSKQSQLEYVFLEQVKLANGLWLSGLNTLQIKSSEVLKISGLSNITTVSITGGVLEDALDVTSIKNLRNTTSLDLSSNRISSLADELFDGLKELFHLQLSANQLTSISGLVFRELQNLIGIDLSNNLLTTIHPDAFENNKRLITIKLQNNRLSFKDDKTPFIHVNNLKFLDLSNNRLTIMPLQLMKLNRLEEVNLNNNNITAVNFSSIRQSCINIHPTHKQLTETEYSDISTPLNQNPLNCECDKFHSLLKTDPDSVSRHECSTYYMNSCERNCPSDCSCIKTSSRHTMIYCKDKQLVRLPKIEFMNATSIELDISNNSLKELPMMDENLRVTIIQASYNQISKIEIDKLPSTLRSLNLSHNAIRTVPANVIRHFKSNKNFEQLFLRENPLECYCFSNDTEELIKFADENSHKTDLKGAKCNELYELSIDGLNKRCKDDVSLIIITILVIISVAILLIFIKHFKSNIKMWLYAHDWFLWWVDEEYVDKVYDIFISYANENRMLAFRITYALENCNIFKVCLHERDFVVGEGIERSVQRAVRNSRRTLVILSESYLNSVWCEHEFHLAWERSVAEKRKLIIAVKDGNLGEITDEIIQSYIETHTYIESVDEWFWERLIFRLPHKKTSKNIFPIREWDGSPLDIR